MAPPYWLYNAAPEEQELLWACHELVENGEAEWVL